MYEEQKECENKLSPLRYSPVHMLLAHPLTHAHTYAVIHPPTHPLPPFPTHLHPALPLLCLVAVEILDGLAGGHGGAGVLGERREEGNEDKEGIHKDEQVTAVVLQGQGVAKEKVEE